MYKSVINSFLIFSDSILLFFICLLIFIPHSRLLKEVFYSEDHPSVAALKSDSNVSNELSLYECLDMYFNEERVRNALHFIA